jgi:hypothetical protein
MNLSRLLRASSSGSIYRAAAGRALLRKDPDRCADRRNFSRSNAYRTLASSNPPCAELASCATG